jgi:hypothetical protein
MCAVRIVAATFFAIALSGCNKWSDTRIAETKRRGDIVCRVTEAYRAKTGRYPSQFEELQPEFLREIPQPTAGDKQWQYMVIDHGTNYWLHVVASEFGPSLDKTASAAWEYMDDHGKRNI